MKYYAIKVDVHIRIHRAMSPQTACHEAYGVVYDRGQAVYKILPKSPKQMSATAMHQALHTSEGWIPLTRQSK